jgi:hypothetical protein
MEISPNQHTQPMTGKRRIEFTMAMIDEVLAEESIKLEELKQVVEENGTELTEEQLIFGWFANFRQANPDVH